jgi:hypothetical protein
MYVPDRRSRYAHGGLSVGINASENDRMAALIAWLPVVGVGGFVKGGAISAFTRVFDALWRRHLRRS